MAQKEELRAGIGAAEKPAQMSGTTIYLIAMGGFFLAVILASLSAL
jgi:hypothetical protein